MSSTWGNKIRFSIFGESHGPAIGGVLDGLPPGMELDMDFIQQQMDRRKPGQDRFSTKRKETDQVEILSGFFEGKTTGTPLAFIIRNEDNRSRDYAALKSKMRPGHADWTGHLRYQGYNDYRGGGHFSGRITAPFVFYGAVAKQYLLENYGIQIVSRIASIGNVEDEVLDHLSADPLELLKKLKNQPFPVMEEAAGTSMKQVIDDARNQQDSVGGVVECMGFHIPAGVGSPFFDSLESTISHLIFSVPATKAALKGSQANDVFYYDEEGRMQAKTNHNGGIQGGISNGLPLVFRVAFKPTPSISKEQETVDIENKENVALSIQGRHDPCIVPRALPVVESCMAIALLEELVI
ncbi:chorismate synthase [Alkalibacter rhizosphaerae]|uniref:Chorismate synthase n=1 Tax=Alkalibacter rhizosphaerae TaxID=2815577 RepID=A0A975AHV9_9FIRM|nr:chorismate synthase [Alkalibacter rhizosphaerae]QSX07900.1 chorismate synthase [Alkalibacter rhizosphaerae]